MWYGSFGTLLFLVTKGQVVMSREQDPFQVPVRATVTKVEERYVVTYPRNKCGDLTERDSVTFSLSDWQGGGEPECGQIVELLDTSLYSRGWRAKKARPVTPKRRQQEVRSA